MAAPSMSSFQVEPNNVIKGDQLKGRAVMIMAVPGVNPEEHEARWKELQVVLEQFTDDKLMTIGIPVYSPEEEVMFDREKLVDYVHGKMSLPLFLTQPVTWEFERNPQHPLFRGLL